MNTTQLPKDIDFTMFVNDKSKAHTHKRDFGIAVLLIVGIFCVLGLGGLIAIYAPDQESIVPVLAVLMGIVFFVTVFLVFVHGIRKFGHQRKQMELFAKNNGWTYDGTRRKSTELATLPPGFPFNPKEFMARFTITGKVRGVSFELSQHMGTVRHTLQRLIASSYVNQSLVWVTILRLPKDAVISKNPDFFYDKDDNYTYIIHPANAVYRDMISSLFACIST